MSSNANKVAGEASIKGRLARGSIWIVAARVLSNLFQLISMVVLARILGPAAFGLVALAASFTAIAASLTETSLAAALVHHDEPSPAYINTAWTINALRGVVVAAVLSAVAYPLALAYQDSRLAPVLIVLGLGTAINGCASPRIALLVKNLVFHQQFIMEAGQKAVTLVVSLAIALAYNSYWAIVLGTFSGQLAFAALSYIIAPLQPRFDLSKIRELLSFSIWLFLAQVVNTVNWKYDQIVLGFMTGKVSLGHYTVGDTLAVLPTREVVTPLTATLFPAFRSIVGDRDRLRAAYSSAQMLVTSCALPIGIVTACLSRPLVELVLGPDWAPVGIVIKILACVYAVQTIGSLSHPLAMATGLTRLLFIRDLQSFALRIPVVSAGLYLGGFLGVLYARVITGTSTILFNIWIVRTLLGLSLRRQLLSSWRTFLAGGAMAIVTSQLEQAVSVTCGPMIVILIAGAAGTLAYLAGHLLLWVLAGRPAGPETLLLSTLERLTRRFIAPNFRRNRVS